VIIVRYVFGPVPSRRLGLSLGVDVVPLKTCSFDCTYCQLGRTACKTTQRGSFARINEVSKLLGMLLRLGLTNVNSPADGKTYFYWLGPWQIDPGLAGLGCFF